MRLKLCGAAIAVMLVVAGCGGSSSNTSTHASGSTTRAPGRRVLHYVNKYPRPANPGPHPNARIDHLIVRDVRKGIGPAIQAGDTGQFEFIATNYDTGKQIESSWHRRRPFETQIEHNVVIDGWWQGIPGMRVGGRRQIVIPPALGFTTNPVLNGATTYFDVVLNQITPAQPRGLSGGSGGAQAGGGTPAGSASG